MADKFPALDSIDNEVPTNDSTEDVGESDFLSREKELLGDEFKTEDDKDALEGSDDEINDFKEQFPDVEDTKADEEEESETEDKGFEDDNNTGFSSDASKSIEDSKPIAKNGKSAVIWKFLKEKMLIRRRRKELFPRLKKQLMTFTKTITTKKRNIRKTF